jgi:hypothetical protein
MAYDHAALRFVQNFEALDNQTPYRGDLYRSKLAARWAAFFDALRIEHVYLPTAFRLPTAMSFQPDFWLPRLGAWLIVRPVDPLIRNADRWKVELLAQELPACRVWIASGVPRAGEWYVEQLGGGARAVARALLLADAEHPAERVWICGVNDDSERLIFDPIDVAGNVPYNRTGRPADPNSDPLMRMAYSHVENLNDDAWAPLAAFAARHASGRHASRMQA